MRFSLRDSKQLPGACLARPQNVCTTTVKRTGDGSLIEFRSVVDAVRCAIEVQNGMVERNAGLPPERRIEFRVGIHLGDVVEESDGDLMGDGVNIAARLEGICEPGAICRSEDAYRQVSGRLDMAVADLGPTQLKNIERPIRVYSLEVGQPAVAKPATVAKPEPKGRSRLALLVAGLGALLVIAVGAWHFLGANRSALVATPSVAVLPFDYMGGDEQSGRLADGVTEDVIANLARYKDFLVIGRNSTMAYKGKPVDAWQVAEDLNVGYVLAGSIQHQDDQLRVTNGDHASVKSYISQPTVELSVLFRAKRVQKNVWHLSASRQRDRAE